jgi:hypothetical protein
MAGEARMSRPEMNDVDEGLIHAWLDGELSAEDAARVERLAATDAAWSAAVAEARGFIAASSRIVGALDAVPGGVIPAGAVAAPVRRSAVRPWMRMAAGFVLVVGVGYAARGIITRSQGAVAASDDQSIERLQPPTLSDSISAFVAQQPSVRETPAAAPLTAPTNQPAASAPRTEVAVAPPPAPVVASAPTPAPAEHDVVGKTSVQREAEERAVAERQALSATADRMRGEIATTAVAPSAAPMPARRSPDDASRDRARSVAGGAGAAASGPLAALDGCWRATAPDSLAALYRDPTILRQAGDTLTLVLPNANLVVVLRRDDTLRGALTATRVSCPPESSTTPRD